MSRWNPSSVESRPQNAWKIEMFGERVGPCGMAMWLAEENAMFRSPPTVSCESQSRTEEVVVL